MGKFRVVEHFISINGEGRRAGQLAMFIRFAGCNLNCEYCDTKWANEPDAVYEELSTEELLQMIQNSGVKNITLTGGEPLLQPDISELLGTLRQNSGIRIEIETNGSIDITNFYPNYSDEGNMEPALKDNVTFTLDYKTAASGMEDKMYLPNFQDVRSTDTVKFVVGGRTDLEKAKEIIETYSLREKGCGIYLSPCFGKIEPAAIVDYLVEQKLNDVNIQLQMHKYIWNPDKRGV